MESLPHTNLYTRLKPSVLGGVGVFAICDIPKGAYIFQGDATKTVTVPIETLDTLPPAIRKMYEDFCAFEPYGMVCPESFNAMSIAWFLNHSETDPNVGCDEEYKFFTLRDVQEGEELVSDYGTYSQLPPGYKKFVE